MTVDWNLSNEKTADEWAAVFDAPLHEDDICAANLWQKPFAMKKALEWSNADSPKVRSAGFYLTAALAENLRDSDPDELGFFDHFLFLARKFATDENMDARRSVVRALAALARRSSDWREAVIETCEEIAAQPSEWAQSVASQTQEELTTPNSATDKAGNG